MSRLEYGTKSGEVEGEDGEPAEPYTDWWVVRIEAARFEIGSGTIYASEAPPEAEDAAAWTRSVAAMIAIGVVTMYRVAHGGALEIVRVSE